MPSFILIRPTVWPQCTNVTHRTDRQRTDSIGRTVLQTVAQKLVKQQYLLQMSSQYGKRRPNNGEIGLPVSGTPANLNWFRVLASLLQRRRSPEANQTLHGVWSSTGCCTIYTFSGLLHLTGFFQVQNSRCVQVLRSPIGLLAALLSARTPAVGVSQTLWR